MAATDRSASSMRAMLEQPLTAVRSAFGAQGRRGQRSVWCRGRARLGRRATRIRCVHAGTPSVAGARRRRARLARHGLASRGPVGDRCRRSAITPARAAGVPFVVGAYGWVDRPSPPAPGGIRGPARSNAPAGSCMRRARPTPQPPRSCAIERSTRPTGCWDIALDSQRIRAALRLAAYIRAGITLAEALGREASASSPRQSVSTNCAARFRLGPKPPDGRSVTDKT